MNLLTLNLTCWKSYSIMLKLRRIKVFDDNEWIPHKWITSLRKERTNFFNVIISIWISNSLSKTFEKGISRFSK
jgi:hypothetical protein